MIPGVRTSRCKRLKKFGSLVPFTGTHCNPRLLNVESCFIEIATGKSQFNLQAFTFTTFDCSFTTCALETDLRTF